MGAESPGDPPNPRSSARARPIPGTSQTQRSSAQGTQITTLGPQTFAFSLLLSPQTKGRLLLGPGAFRGSLNGSRIADLNHCKQRTNGGYDVLLGQKR